MIRATSQISGVLYRPGSAFDDANLLGETLGLREIVGPVVNFTLHNVKRSLQA